MMLSCSSWLHSPTTKSASHSGLKIAWSRNKQDKQSDFVIKRSLLCNESTAEVLLGCKVVGLTGVIIEDREGDH